jgi:N-acyl-D-aspartate/D-glutamate deacylase
MAADYDLVIRNGEIVDGTGGARFVADIAVKDGVIVEVGAVAGGGREEVNAAGLIVTPGFVDIHTHYDGQATWEHRMMPSSNHGVTTVVMGNCGVGFAPCRPKDRKSLVQLMEGVEDVPEIVMEEGLPWNWETFPEYLDALEARSYDIDLGTQLPHAPLRVYVMGDRAVAGETATADELVQMTDLAEEAIRAGALGFATSRNLFHRDSTGAGICTREAEEAELVAVADGLRRAGTGVIEAVLDLDLERLEAEFPLLRRMVETSGRPLSFSLFDVLHAPKTWRRGLDLVNEAQADGLPISAQVMGRPTGFLFGLSLSYHPFSFYPSYAAIAHLPLEDRVAEMRKPEFRARLLSEKPDDSVYETLQLYLRYYEWTFKLGDPPNYEPSPDTSILAIARRKGISPDEVALDMLLEDDGKSVLFVTAANYAGGTLDHTVDMLVNGHTLLGLGDGGAHYGLICDASVPTFMLTYWTRDRDRGVKFPLEEMVKRLTSDNAFAVGLCDRGVIAPGYKANINVIDYQRLALHAPRMSADLPGGGSRLSQEASGYVAIVVAGEVTYREGVPTGALPGRLVRGSQHPAAIAA